MNLGPLVNSPYDDSYPCLSADGLLLFFSDDSGVTPRPGGYGAADMWMTRRTSLSEPWQATVNLGPIVNGPGEDVLPVISPDGRTLYFWSSRNGSLGTWQAPIIANFDLNGDGQVDQADIGVLLEHSGQDYSLCDIGPSASAMVSWTGRISWS